jgi:CHASE2 domain-containing sensor protein
MNPLNDHPEVRRYAYYALFAAGLILGACQVGYAAADAGHPDWLTVALAVLAFVGSYLGLTAAANTPHAPKPDYRLDGD